MCAKTLQVRRHDGPNNQFTSLVPKTVVDDVKRPPQLPPPPSPSGPFLNLSLSGQRSGPAGGITTASTNVVVNKCLRHCHNHSTCLCEDTTP